MGKILGLPCKLDRLSKSFVKFLKKHFNSFLLIVPGQHYHLTLSNVANEENFSIEITEELVGS